MNEARPSRVAPLAFLELRRWDAPRDRPSLTGVQIQLRARAAELRCAFCHDELPEAPWVCPRCLTQLHLECWIAHARCPTIGCPRVLFVRVRQRRLTLPRVSVVLVPAVAAVLALVALVALNFGKAGCHSGMPGAVKGQIAVFKQCLDSFYADCGRYPTRAEGLEALRGEPPATKGWKGPYLSKDVPNDPWGNPYQYRSPGAHGPSGHVETFDLWSNGPDGKEGTPDDIQSWALDSRQ